METNDCDLADNQSSAHYLASFVQNTLRTKHDIVFSIAQIIKLRDRLRNQL